MAIWKPKPFIRVKVLGLVWRGDELLAGEVEDSSGRVTGVRPLGGCVEFGETREAAIRREFQEELGCAVTRLIASFGVDKMRSSGR
jgi:NADH pyrophosphatase NudC (nudix superfamily)